MRITVLFDEKAACTKYQTGFGLSLLVGDSVLFDTGSDGEVLAHNIKALDVDTAAIEAVVLSHAHWDHADGLARLLSMLPAVTVYICPGFPPQLKKLIADKNVETVTSFSPEHICGNIYTTGELDGEYGGAPMPEQALFVKYDDSRVALICGCAHFGIAKSFAAIRKRIEIFFGRNVMLDFVIGGLHLSHESDDFIRDVSHTLYAAGVRRIAPIHCSGENGRRVLSSCNECTVLDRAVGSVLEI